VIGDGEQSRQHFVHGFLEQVEGIDFEHKVEMGIRNDRYKAMVPQVVAPLALKGRVHETEARFLRAHTTRRIKFTLPGPMTIVDTVADRHYGDRVKMAFAFAELLNQEALALQADGVDIVQFDEPAFNVYMDDAADWGVQGAGARRAGPDLHDGRAHLLRLRHPGQRRLEEDAGRRVAPVRAGLPGAGGQPHRPGQPGVHPLARAARPDGLLKDKDVMVGVIDVASDTIETPEEVADTIGRGAAAFVPRQRLIACTNCGLAPMRREVAEAKLRALAASKRFCS
jgi:5-methyltetrahydropteroyltriglutamate--homocysteine methyltransferase